MLRKLLYILIGFVLFFIIAVVFINLSAMFTYQSQKSTQVADQSSVCHTLSQNFLSQPGVVKPEYIFSTRDVFNTQLGICFLEIQTASKVKDNNGLYYYSYDIYDLTNKFIAASYKGKGDGHAGEELQTDECVLNGSVKYACSDLKGYKAIATQLFSN